MSTQFHILTHDAPQAIQELARAKLGSDYEPSVLAARAPLLPEYMLDGVSRYVLFGVPPGSFLTAVLRSDLIAAAQCADDINRRLLFDWAAFVYQHLPMVAVRSYFDGWVAAGGLVGHAVEQGARRVLKQRTQLTEKEQTPDRLRVFGLMAAELEAAPGDAVERLYNAHAARIIRAACEG